MLDLSGALGLCVLTHTERSYKMIPVKGEQNRNYWRLGVEREEDLATGKHLDGENTESQGTAGGLLFIATST